jgi:hypothetical protein
MPDKSIMALPDLHTDSAARIKARDMMSEGQIGVFYIEWSKPIDPHNLDKTFEGMAPGDAKPTLKDLTQYALDRGIPVVPVDLAPDKVLKALDDQNPAYAPHSHHSLVQPWGEAVRDKYTAGAIAEDMSGRGKDTIGLLMYGADHFKPKKDGDEVLAESLDTLIRGHKVADVYTLKLTYGQDQPAAEVGGSGASQSTEQSQSARKM